MAYLLIGSILTLINLFIGGVVGYLIGSKKLEKKIEQIKSKFKPPPTESGAVKQYTKLEKEELDNKEHQRMKELIP